MAFAHAELSEAELGPGVWKVVGPSAPAPLRGMVARGLAPLPPRDLVVAIYHLWCTNDPEHAENAAKTIEGLPKPIVEGALGDPDLPAGALDFLGRKLVRDANVLDRIVRHKNVDDQTLIGLARVCPEVVCDTLADNQQRWSQCPAIVEALYHNPNCRMSVVHRMLEFALREGIEVRLPNMDEIRQAMEESGAPDPSRDHLFSSVAKTTVGESHDREIEHVKEAAPTQDVDPDASRVGEDAADLDLEALLDLDEGESLSLPLEEAAADPEKLEQLPVKARGYVQITQMRPMEKIRLAMLGDAFERGILIRDSNRTVAMSAIKSPRVKETEVVAYAANRTLSHDVVRYIVTRRDWTKLYQVKLNLVMNPKTPLSAAMGFLGHLHQHDVRRVAHSKNVPAALATAAKRKLSQRG